MEILIISAIILGVYFLAYVLETGLNTVVRSPALLDQRKRADIEALDHQTIVLEDTLKSLRQQKEKLSKKAIEILVALAEAPPGFANIVSSSDDLMVGDIGIRCSNPLELKEYQETIEAELARGNWIKSVGSSMPYYEPTFKGLKKGREILESDDGKIIVKELHKKFPRL